MNTLQVSVSLFLKRDFVQVVTKQTNEHVQGLQLKFFETRKIMLVMSAER
jgi:hypothetical protein